MLLPPPRSTLFPYTTLFRSSEAGYMVITGAASGIMEAGHVGAGRENSIGVNILLPFEQYANPIIAGDRDRKSTRLNSSHEWISYAVFCLKKKKKHKSRNLLL